jgi:hypothetical protein
MDTFGSSLSVLPLLPVFGIQLLSLAHWMLQGAPRPHNCETTLAHRTATHLPSSIWAFFTSRGLPALHADDEEISRRVQPQMEAQQADSMVIVWNTPFRGLKTPYLSEISRHQRRQNIIHGRVNSKLPGSRMPFLWKWVMPRRGA